MLTTFPSLITSFIEVLASVQCTAIADGVTHHILENVVNLSVRRVSLSLAIVVFLFATISASAQLSFPSAVDLALQNSPRVKMAQDDLNKATAILSESKAVFIPSLSGSIGAGPSYGITTSVPTIFTLNAQSLVFNFSQFDYVRAARAGVQAASATLVDVREQVEEDTALTYISLDRAQRRQKAMSDEYGYAVRLVSIVQLRLDAGMESQLELKQVRRTALQIKLQQEQLEDEIASLQDHFSQLIGLPADQLGTISSSIPSGPSSLLSSTERPNEYPDTPSVLSAEANALAKRKQATGDSHNTWRPQIAFSAQYGRISPFNGAATYYNLNGNYNTAYAAAQVQLPFFDSTRKAKARESLAEAQHAEHTVEFLREQQSATRLKLQHSITELETKAELAEVDQGIAQDQLNAMLVRLTSGNGTGSTPPMTPKDEMNARILERQRYLEMLDATFQLREQQIYLLRQTGQLQNWIQSLANVRPTTPMERIPF